MNIKALQLSLMLLLTPISSNAVVVLQYHHIDNDTPSSTSTSIGLFQKHIQYIINHNFNVISIPELISNLKANKPLNENTVAITFDDGYESVYRHAFPILKKHKLPFTVFIDTAAIEEKRRDHVSWQQISEMKLAGATIANHTHRHSHLVRNQESMKDWKERVVKDITEAQDILKARLNQDIKILAYPYGEFDNNTVKVVSELGYSAFGQHSGAINLHSNPLYLPRFPVSNHFGQFPQVITKLKSIAFNKLHFEPMHGVLTTYNQSPPVLTIKGDSNLFKKVHCYGPSGKLIELKSKTDSVSYKASEAPLTRRFRYNCTAKVEDKNRFKWISIPWINQTIEKQ